MALFPTLPRSWNSTSHVFLILPYISHKKKIFCRYLDKLYERLKNSQVNISRNKDDQIASKGPNRLRESEEVMRTHNPRVVYIIMVMVVYGNSGSLPRSRAQIKPNCHKNWLVWKGKTEKNLFSALPKFRHAPLFFPRNDVRGQEWGQIFHTHDLSQPRSGKCFQLVEPQRKFASTNQKNNPNLGSDTSSAWNFCSGSSDIISRETDSGVAKCGCSLRLGETDTTDCV